MEFFSCWPSHVQVYEIRCVVFSMTLQNTCKIVLLFDKWYPRGQKPNHISNMCLILFCCDKKGCIKVTRIRVASMIFAEASLLDQVIYSTMYKTFNFSTCWHGIPHVKSVFIPSIYQEYGMFMEICNIRRNGLGMDLVMPRSRVGITEEARYILIDIL